MIFTTNLPWPCDHFAQFASSGVLLWHFWAFTAPGDLQNLGWISLGWIRIHSCRSISQYILVIYSAAISNKQHFLRLALVISSNSILNHFSKSWAHYRPIRWGCTLSWSCRPHRAKIAFDNFLLCSCAPDSFGRSWLNHFPGRTSCCSGILEYVANSGCFFYSLFQQFEILTIWCSNFLSAFDQNIYLLSFLHFLYLAEWTFSKIPICPQTCSAVFYSSFAFLTAMSHKFVLMVSEHTLRSYCRMPRRSCSCHFDFDVVCFCCCQGTHQRYPVRSAHSRPSTSSAETWLAQAVFSLLLKVLVIDLYSYQGKIKI